MNLSYTRGIPATNNDPSVDQGPMQTNTNSTDDWVDIDHFGFNDNNGGLHRQVRMINQAVIPTGLISGMATTYSKLATSTGVLTESNLFFTPSNSGNEYQITRPITASFSLFSGMTNNYNGSGTRFTAGWTFLPGGMLFQYGSVTHTNETSTTVLFPVEFSNSSSIVVILTPISTNNDDHSCNLSNSAPTTTQFNVRTTSSSQLTGFTWIAIGK